MDLASKRAASITTSSALSAPSSPSGSTVRSTWSAIAVRVVAHRPGTLAAAACSRANARSMGSPVRCSSPSVYSSTVSPGSGAISTLGASQQASMPSGADSEVSTNSVRRSPMISGGACPAPARTILRRAGSQ